MYQLEWVQQRVAARRQPPANAATAAPARVVSRTVWLLGLTSCLTDISSEMVNGILPLYLVGFLRFSPLQFGVIDGLYQGVSAVLRLVGGIVADKWQRHKETAAAGYGLSAMCKLALLFTTSSWTAIAGVIALDRTGKGLRTPPRDALITLNSEPGSMATSFGVHRALDAGGALLGPVLAFLILAAAPGAFDVIFVTSFSIAVLGVAVLLLFVTPARTAALPAAARAAAKSAAQTPLATSPFVALIVAASALSIATMSDAFIYLTLQERLTFSPGVFPLLYVATSLVYMAAAIPAGRLADRFGRRTVFIGGYTMVAVVYAMLLMPGIGIAGAAIAILALGSYYAATDGVLMAIAGRMLPPDRCATGLAVLSTFTSAARLLSSVAFGWVWTTGDVNSAVAVFGVALAIAVLVAVLALRYVDEPPLTSAR
jgi:MFS family permease